MDSLKKSYYPDTIIAVATGSQNGPVGIIRLSGPKAKEIVQHRFVNQSGESLEQIKPRYLYYGHILSENRVPLDDVLFAYMPGPHSYTGEDVVELHCHGNQNLMNLLIDSLLKAEPDELRPANAGEFTKRAFLNGKLDLVQAEAVHGLISAESDAALKSHLSNLDGRLSRLIDEMTDQLKESLARIEASFEFPEEDIQTFDKDAVIVLLKDIQVNLKKLIDAHETSKLYDHGVKVALVGAPNVGKSSTLNALLLEDRAIVTNVAGTTRDVVNGDLLINGIRFKLFDTAGLRETKDEIESHGIKRSQEKVDTADIVCLIRDPEHNFEELNLKLPENVPILRFLNKVDTVLTSEDYKNEATLKELHEKYNVDLCYAAKLEWGVTDVKQCLIKSLNVHENVQNFIHVNGRQKHFLEIALRNIEDALRQLNLQVLNEELISENLRDVILRLTEVTGDVSSDDILGEIFSRFCIGK